MQFECFNCHTQISFVDRVGFRDECEKCGHDAHVCLNCLHYDIRSYHECRESTAEYVREKNRNNYCDHFIPQDKSQQKMSSSEELKKAAEKLFKK